jgi:nicotinic acetylcholine receptor
MNIAWFPFDEQKCTIIFGSWSYTSNLLNYTMLAPNPSLKNFTDSSEWTLIEYKPTRFEIKYDHWFDNNSFSEIKYQIIMKRKSLFVLQNYVTAALILCTLTLVSFFIPFAQAMQIGISILLAFAVFKLRLSDDVPVQSDSIPLINYYFTICITFSLSSMIWFSIVNSFREKKKLPKLIKYFIIKYVNLFYSQDKEINNNNNIEINNEKELLPSKQYIYINYNFI